MGLGNIFGRRKSSNAMNAMMAVQKMKNLGTTEMLSMSQIVNLITNLPDAQKIWMMTIFGSYMPCSRFTGNSAICVR